ncbi:hypothetical protein GCM10011611_01860 [Aliidongia dinghuensis]|uniref:Uncharacterized protein n=2 Tax=Aliidongia dinghuensis TaxID=1867774 RepID=A0A8J2YPY0_9PROT|nr:hypothetical protein GCM10011611_01860 [Aliidongia dinghuensis]
MLDEVTMIPNARRLRHGFAAALLAGLAGATAFAQTAPAPATPASPKRQCFSLTDWRGGWRAPNPSVIYIRVNISDVWRIDLSTPSNQLMWPDRHLVSVARGGDAVCAPIDLDLKVADTHGYREPLIAKAITKLTPEEVAALPVKDRP